MLVGRVGQLRSPRHPRRGAQDKGHDDRECSGQRHGQLPFVVNPSVSESIISNRRAGCSRNAPATHATAPVMIPDMANTATRRLARAFILVLVASSAPAGGSAKGEGFTD